MQEQPKKHSLRNPCVSLKLHWRTSREWSRRELLNKIVSATTICIFVPSVLDIHRRIFLFTNFLSTPTHSFLFFTEISPPRLKFQSFVLSIYLLDTFLHESMINSKPLLSNVSLLCGCVFVVIFMLNFRKRCPLYLLG